MMTNEVRIDAPGVQSLVWAGDVLVDWVAGGARYHLDGTFERSGVNLSYRFDAAVATPDGEWAVIYERLGTKGLVLRRGQQFPLVREIDRSYYCAEAYEFPVAVWRAPDGRPLLAHCPDEYNQLVLADLESAAPLPGMQRERELPDIFHSRLQVNPARTRLLSAGWVWHPFDVVLHYDLEEAERNPAELDALPAPVEDEASDATACWQTNTRLLIGRSEDQTETPRLSVFDVASSTEFSSVELERPPGTMMPVGDTHVLCLFEHPRIRSLETGRIAHEWPHLPTGNQAGAIIHHLSPPPPLALDPARGRFAVAIDDAIHVVTVKRD